MFPQRSTLSMNSTNLKLPGLLSLVLLAYALAAAQQTATLSQPPTAGSATGVNAAFVKLFGNVTAFSARMETQVLDRSGQESVRMPMDFATLSNKVRMDLNLEQTVSRDLPANMISVMKQQGMERIISIFRPDQKATLLLYPGPKRYQALPLAKGEADAIDKGLQVEKTALGKETIDGHACVKNQVVVRNQQGPVLRATTWNATDLKDLPIRVEMKKEESKVVITFKQVQFAKPDPKRFDVPDDYVKLQ
jgi:hypothetical protein